MTDDNQAITDTILALADDLLVHFPPDFAVEPDDVHDWLVAQAAAIQMHPATEESA